MVDTAPPTGGAAVAEESALGRLAGWCYDHRWRVLLLWIAAIVLITVVAQSMGSRFQESFGSGNSRLPTGAEPAGRPVPPDLGH